MKSNVDMEHMDPFAKDIIFLLEIQSYVNAETLVRKPYFTNLTRICPKSCL